MTQEPNLIESPWSLFLSTLLSLSKSTSKPEQIIRTYTELYAIKNVCFVPVGPKVVCFDSEACVFLSIPRLKKQFGPFSLRRPEGSVPGSRQGNACLASRCEKSGRRTGGVSFSSTRTDKRLISAGVAREMARNCG